ncbi:hypothetical protein HFD88_005468 [Aspergillus terreus]|nr:hypothetical protein HFD88_005468 [Aspergillus terreus]
MDMSVETAKRCQDIYGLGARLFIGNIPNRPAQELVLNLVFSCFGMWADGGVFSVLLTSRRGNRVAWVQYRTRAEAQGALAYAQARGVSLLSRLLRVEWARGRNYGKGRQRWYQ